MRVGEPLALLEVSLLCFARSSRLLVALEVSLLYHFGTLGRRSATNLDRERTLKSHCLQWGTARLCQVALHYHYFFGARSVDGE